MIIENLIILSVLLLFGIADVRHMSIDSRWVAVAGVSSAIYGIWKFTQKCEPLDMLLLGAGIIFIVFLLVTCFLQKIMGAGDFFIILMIMFIKGIVASVTIFVASVCVMGIVVMIRNLFSNHKKIRKVAFIPYIWISTLGVILCI